MLSGHKHQHTLPFLLYDQMAQQLGTPGRIHQNGLLRDVRLFLVGAANIDLHRIAQHGLRQCRHCGRKGGGEKQALSLCRQQGQQALEFGFKAEFQQAVGLVQYQDLRR